MRQVRGAVLACLVALAAGLATTPDAVAASAVVSPAPRAAALTSFQAVSADSVVDKYGVGIHLPFLNTPYVNTAAVAAKLRELGVRHVRDDLDLNQPGLPARIASVADAAGVRFDLIAGRPTDTVTPADYVAAVAALPPGVVESIEGANEWDLSGRDNWVEEVKAWQQDLYAAAKTDPATSALPVLSPALAFRQHYAAVGDLSATADVANAHMYPGGYRPTNEITRITQAVRGSLPSEPLVTTEAGYHNALGVTDGHRPVPEDVAGAYTPRVLLEHVLRGEQRVYTYELIDEFDDPDQTDREAHFGMLRRDLTPKPAYTAMKNLLGLLSDPGSAFTPGSLQAAIDGFPSDGRYLLTQKRDGRFVLLLWRDVALYDPEVQQPLAVTPTPVTLRLGGAADLTVNRPSAGAEPTAHIQATTLPLSLDGQVTAVTIGPPAAEPTPVAPGTLPGRPKIAKTLPGASRVRVTWRAPRDGGLPLLEYQVAVGRRVVTVKAGRTAATLRGLVDGRRVRVTVRARNELGWGSWSRARTVTPGRAKARASGT